MKNRHKKPRHGAVGVVVEAGRFLVIRRSLTVRAPGLLCFPGGSIEAGETPEQAVVRELHEELELKTSNPTHLWHSCTSWGTLLEWLWVERHPASEPIANPSEVADVMWLDPHDLLSRSDLLGSVNDFFAAWAIGHFTLPDTAGTPHEDWRRMARQ